MNSACSIIPEGIGNEFYQSLSNIRDIAISQDKGDIFDKAIDNILRQCSGDDSRSGLRDFVIYLTSEYEVRNPQRVFGSPNTATSTRMYGDHYGLLHVLAGMYKDAKVDGLDNLANNIRGLASLVSGEGSRFNIHSVFCPDTNITRLFSQYDAFTLAGILTKCYFDHIESFKSVNSSVAAKNTLLKLFKEDIDKYIKENQIHRSRYKELNVKYVMEELNKPNSFLYDYFVNYIYQNEGINLKRGKKKQNHELSTETYIDSNLIEHRYDFTQGIDQCETLAQEQKVTIAKTVGHEYSKNDRSCKFYLPKTMDVRTMFPHLVSAFSVCKTRDEYRTQLDNLAIAYPELIPLKKMFDAAFNNDEAAIQFVNSFIAGIGLEIAPVDVLTIGDKVEIITKNKEAFPDRVLADKLNEVFDNFATSSTPITYNKVTKTVTINDKSYELTLPEEINSENVDIIAAKFDEVLTSLGVPSRLNGIKFALLTGNRSLADLCNRVISDIVYQRNNKSMPDRTGYIYHLGKILSTDLYSTKCMTYIDAEGSLCYTPQHSSFLTKFNRNWIKNGKVDTDAIKASFKDVLEDPILKESSYNYLMYNPETNTGIFVLDDKGEYQVSNKFIEDLQSGSQFKISAFNGIISGDLGFKYQTLQGSTYTFSDFVLGSLNRYTFLTSDSPRSYCMTMSKIGIEDLFKPASDVTTLYGKTEINEDSAAFKYLKDIVLCDLRYYDVFGTEIFNKNNTNDVRKYHGVTFGKNGKFINDKGIPTGRGFQFLTLTYVENNEIMTLVDYVVKRENIIRASQNKPLITKSDVYSELIKKTQGEPSVIDTMLNDSVINEFVKEWINWTVNEIEQCNPIAEDIWNKILKDKIGRKIEQKTFEDLVEQEIKDSIKSSVDRSELEAKQRGVPFDRDQYEAGIRFNNEIMEQHRSFAIQKINDSVTTTTCVPYRKFMIESFINKAIQTKFVNDMFDGNLNEYKNTTEYNKRIAQATKTGVELIELADETENVRRVLVINDLEFRSNIVNKVFGEGEGKSNDETIREAHNQVSTINDSQSFITDKTFEKFLKATGRWNENSELRQYVKDLRNPNIVFDPSKYKKLVEQLKCFGTARMKRSKFLQVYDNNDPFGNVVDTVQIKDSTVVLFKPMIAGSALEQMYDFMDQNDIDQISPISAVKVSGITPLTIHDIENGRFIGNKDNVDLRYHVLNLRNSDFVIQQDMPSEMLDETIVVGTQMLKQSVEGLVANDAVYTINGKKYTGVEVVKMLNYVLDTNTKESTIELLYDLCEIADDGTIVTDQSGNPVFSPARIAELCKESLEGDSAAVNLREMIQIDENGNPTVSLSIGTIANKVASVIASRFTQAAINKHTNGFVAPIRPDMFTVHNELIDHSGIYARVGDDIEDVEKKHQAYNEMIDDYAKNGGITWSSDFIERCKKERRAMTLQAEHRIENGTKFIYAEVIASPWMSEFYQTISTTKDFEIEVEIEEEVDEIDEQTQKPTGRKIKQKIKKKATKTVKTIDLDKLSPEARRMVGIRIPTEGKQSMVVFEVVGILNTGATQLIFPQTLVNRTGWDFDIDKVFAYYKALKYDKKSEGYKYTPIEFNESQSAEIRQKSHNFASGLYDKIRSRITSREVFTYVSNSARNNQPTIFDYVINRFSKDPINVQKFIESELDNIGNDKIRNKLSKSIKSNLNRLTTLANKIEGLYFDACEQLTSYGQLSREYRIKSAQLLRDAQKNIYNAWKSLVKFTNVLGELQAIGLDLSFDEFGSYLQNITFIKEEIDKLNDPTSYTTSKIDYSSIGDVYDFVDNMTSTIESKVDDNSGNLDKMLGANSDVYKLNSRDARNNLMIDIITSILSNKHHINEVNKPNVFDHISDISKYVNSLWKSSIDTLNPLNLLDAVKLNNMSMGSTIIKGHSVNIDTLLATLSTIHTKLNRPIYQPIDIRDLPIPNVKGFKSVEDMYYQDDKGYHLTNSYKTFLRSILGTSKKGNQTIDNFSFDSSRGILVIANTYIYNDASNTHLDISGNRVENQGNEFTSAILDLLKSELGFIINIHTVSIARILSMSSGIEAYEFDKKTENGVERVKQLNKFAYAMMFMHQPAIVDIINNINDNTVSDPSYNFNRSYNDIYRKYVKEFVDLAVDKIDNLTPAEIADELKAIVKSDYKVKDEQLAKIAEFLNVLGIETGEYNSFNGTSIYQTSRELEQNIKNRDGDRVTYLSNQIRVLKALEVYNSITQEITAAQFVIKTGTQVKSFYHADSKEETLADVIYPLENIEKTLIKRYEASKPTTESSKEYIADFATCASVTEFNDKYKQDAVLIPYPAFVKAIDEYKGLNTIQSRIEFMKKYGIKAKEVKSIISTADGKDLIESIFTDSESILDDIRKPITDTKSVYSNIQTCYNYGHRVMAHSFDNIFVDRIPTIKNKLRSRIINNKGYISEAVYNKAVDNLRSYLSITDITGTSNSLFDTDQVDDAKRILGINYKRNDDIVNNLKDKDFIINGITDDDFKAYTSLSLADQLEVLFGNKVLANYLNNNPEFGGSNLLAHVQKQHLRNKVSYDPFMIDVHDNGDGLFNNYTQSIAIMWNSNIPFVAHTIREFIASQIITKGYGYGYNVCKYIPDVLITTEIPNESYDSFIKNANKTSILKNFHNINTILIQNHNHLKHIAEAGIGEETIINVVNQAISQTFESNAIADYSHKRLELWKEGKSVATFSSGHPALKIQLLNRVTGFFETEWRLAQTGNAKTNTIIVDKVIYERRLVTDPAIIDPRYKVYLFTPLKKALPGEDGLTQNRSLLPENATEPEYVSVDGITFKYEDYIQSHVNQFLEAVKTRNQFWNAETNIRTIENKQIDDSDLNQNHFEDLTMSEENAELNQTDVVKCIDITGVELQNIENKSISLTDAIKEQITNSDVSIYITQTDVRSGRATHIPTGTININRNYHTSENVITVDYTKSPADEAIRIGKLLKGSKFYINGDIKDFVNMSTNDMYHWTQTFINNLEYIYPGIESISTIANSGFGQIVSKVYSNADKQTINIYENVDRLKATLVVEDPTVDLLQNVYISNGNIANQIIGGLNGLQRFMHNISQNVEDKIAAFRSHLISELYTEESDIEQSLISGDRAMIETCYDEMITLASLVYDTCKKRFDMLSSIDYANIHNDYAKTIDYRMNLLELIKMLKFFEKFKGIQKIAIENTDYREGTEEDIEKFNEEFGGFNSAIDQIQRLYAKSNELFNNACTMTERVFIWEVIDKSRNPVYTTAFSKILEYLEAHDYSLEGFDETTLNISSEEWIKIQQILFSFKHDISWWNAHLDSAFSTGVTLIDITGKAYDEANFRSKRYVTSVIDDVNQALDDHQAGLSKDERARSAIMRKFVNEEGDFIETYDTKGLGISLHDLSESIQNEIDEDFANENYIRDTPVNIALDNRIIGFINDYNKNHTWQLIELNEAEQDRLTTILSDKNDREQYAYLRANHYVAINRIDSGGTPYISYYKLDFTNTPKSEAFEKLTDSERVLLNKLKSIIQDVIYTYNPEWTNFYGEVDTFIPYIPQATFAKTVREYFNVPHIKHDKYFVDIDGSKQQIIKPVTLQLPKKYPTFKAYKRVTESWADFKLRAVKDFNEWVVKNIPANLRSEVTKFEQIAEFNQKLLRENKKYKANTMSYDPVDLMTGFVQELAQIRAVQHYNISHQLVDNLLTLDKGEGSAASHMENAYGQFKNQGNRIANTNKINNPIDVVATGLLRYTSVTYMYLNYTAGITNILKGITDMISYSAAYSFVGSKDLIKNGINAVIKAVPKYLSDIKSTRTDNLDVAIIKDFDDIYQDTRDTQSSMTGSSMWVKILKNIDKGGYLPNTTGEFTMQFGMLLACTHSHRVVGGQIMSLQDFYQDNLEKVLLETLTPEQKTKYINFKEDFDKEIAKYEKKKGIEYHWSHDYASEFIKRNLKMFDKDQRNKLEQELKVGFEKQKTAFEKFPTLHDSLELKDGRLSYKDGSGLNETSMSMFRSRVKAINQSLHGIYNRVDRNSVQDSAIGDLFMQFKKWVIPTIERIFGRRFGQIFYNEQLNAYEVPMSNVVFDMIRNGNSEFKNVLKDDPNALSYLKGLGNWFKGVYNFLTNVKFYYNTLPVAQKASVLQFAKYNAAIAFSLITFCVLRAFDNDDEDSIENDIYKHLLYTSTTLYQEMLQPVPIVGWYMFVEQSADALFAGEKVLNNAIELILLTTKGLWTDSEDMLYDRGAYKGEDKRIVKLRQLIPIYRQWNKLTHLGQTMSYYNRYTDYSGIAGYTTKLIKKASGQEIEDED